MKKGTKLFLCHAELDRRGRLFCNPCSQVWPPRQCPGLPVCEHEFIPVRLAAG